MRIEDNRDGTYVEYGTLQFGEVFESNGEIWIRMDNGSPDPEKNDQSVCLLDGTSVYIDSDCLVKPVRAKVVIE
jgi:hypothetical protein